MRGKPRHGRKKSRKPADKRTKILNKVSTVMGELFVVLDEIEKLLPYGTHILTKNPVSAKPKTHPLGSYCKDQLTNKAMKMTRKELIGHNGFLKDELKNLYQILKDLEPLPVEGESDE